MKLTNTEIYDFTTKLLKSFKGDEVLPIKFNFYLQKNINILIGLATEIEESRAEVGKRYGTYDEEEKTYIIDKDKFELAKGEYDELMQLTQEVNLNTFSIDSLPDSMELSIEQMQAIEFMITEDEH